MSGSNKKMKLVAGFLCLAIVSCEPKAVKLNYPNGTPADPALLLESGSNMTLSYSSRLFGSSHWTLPNGDAVACNNTTPSRRFSVVCAHEYSNLTASNLTTCDTGVYIVRAKEGSSGDDFEYKVEIIQVSVSASVDDDCKSANIVAHIDSKNYEIIEMTSPSLHKDTQHSHSFLLSITTKNLRAGRHELNITVRKRNTSEVQHVNKSVTLNENDKCYRTTVDSKPVLSPYLQTATTPPKNEASVFPIMELLSGLCLLCVMQYMLNWIALRPVFVEFG